MWIDRTRSRVTRGFVPVHCDACAHFWTVDVEIYNDELHPLTSEHCPECGANYDMDEFAAGVVAFRS